MAERRLWHITCARCAERYSAVTAGRAALADLARSAGGAGGAGSVPSTRPLSPISNAVMSWRYGGTAAQSISGSCLTSVSATGYVLSPEVWSRGFAPLTRPR